MSNILAFQNLVSTLFSTRRFLNPFRCFLIVLSAFIVSGFASAQPAKQAEPVQKNIILGYYTNWSPYSTSRPYQVTGSQRMEKGQWTRVDNRGFNKQLKNLNVLVYAFAGIYPNGVKQGVENSERGKIYFTDTWSDLSPADVQKGAFCSDPQNHTACYTQLELQGKSANDNPDDHFGLGNFTAFSKLPHVKRLIAIGGPDDQSGFEQGAFFHSATVDGSTNFVNSLVNLIENYHLDGVDIDYEPTGGYNAQSAAKLVDLVTQLRAAFKQRHWDDKLITMDILSAPDQISAFDGQTHNLQHIAAQLDYINVMAYDYHSATDADYTNFHSNFYMDPNHPKKQECSGHQAIHILSAAGVPVSKLILGVPSFGHVMKHASNKNAGLYQNFRKPSATLSENDNQDADEESYYNIINNWVDNAGFVPHEILRDVGLGKAYKAIASWAYRSHGATGTFVAYDNTAVIDTKAQYVKLNGLGGVAMWELSGDIPPGDLNNASLLCHLSEKLNGACLT